MVQVIEARAQLVLIPRAVFEHVGSHRPCTQGLASDRDDGHQPPISSTTPSMSDLPVICVAPPDSSPGTNSVESRRVGHWLVEVPDHLLQILEIFFCVYCDLLVIST